MRKKGTPIGVPHFYRLPSRYRTGEPAAVLRDHRTVSLAHPKGGLPLAAVVVVAAAAVVVPGAPVIAAAVAHQEHQNDDPPPVVAAEQVADTAVVVTTHKNTSEI